MSSVMPLPNTGQNTELQLVLYAPDNRHMARLGTAIAGQAQLRWADSRELQARELIDSVVDEHALILLDYSGTNASYSSELARQLSGLGSSMPMVGIGISGSDQATYLLAAVRSGVRDFIDLENTTEQILEVFQRVCSQAAPVRPVVMVAPELAPSGRLIVLLGVRPGMGTTTLAAHLGTQISILTSPADGTNLPGAAKQLLIDLGQPSGDAALYLGMESHFGYEEALRSVERIDPTFADTAFARHSSNLTLLGVNSGSLLTPHDPGALLTRLRSVFSLTLCDTGGLPIQHVPTSLLKQATEIWLIADQAIGSLVSLDQTLRDLEQRGLRDQRLQLVVNRFDPASGLSDDQIAQRFGLPLLASLPDRTRALRSSAGLGHLLTESAPRDPYVRALSPLLQRMDRRQASPPSTSPIARLANFLGKEPWKKT